MIRNRISTLLGSASSIAMSFREGISEQIQDHITDRFQELVLELNENISEFELTDDEVEDLYEAWKESPEALHDMIQDIILRLRIRLYLEVFKQTSEQLYRLRLLASTLCIEHYTNHMIQASSFFASFDKISIEVNNILIKQEIESFKQSEKDVAAAMRDLNAFGPIVEE